MLKITKFGAVWCKPCEALQKTIEEILLSYTTKVEYKSVDIEEDLDLATELRIMSVPTVIFEKDGEVVCRFSGTKSGNEIKEIIDEYI
jgi:thioredoxin 1